MPIDMGKSVHLVSGVARCASHPSGLTPRDAAVVCAAGTIMSGRPAAHRSGSVRGSASVRWAAGGLGCPETLLVGLARPERAAFVVSPVDGFGRAEDSRDVHRIITVGVTGIFLSGAAPICQPQQPPKGCPGLVFCCRPP